MSLLSCTGASTTFIVSHCEENCQDFTDVCNVCTF